MANAKHSSGRPRPTSSPYQQFELLNPGKGLNNLVSNTIITDQESPSLLNVKFIQAGAPTKADGFTQIGASFSNNPRGLGHYYDQPNTTHYLMTVDGTALKYSTSATSGSWATLSGCTFNATGTITMTQVEGNMYIWDGVNGGAQVVSGLTLTRPGTMPKAKFSAYWKGIHCAAGVAGQESRLYLTPPGTPSQFTNATGTLSTAGGVPGATVFANTGAQFVDIQPNDADSITGLALFQDNLIIFKERSIFQMTLDGTGTPVITQITQAYGCVAYKSISRVDNDVFFLTRNGIYVLGYEPQYYNIIRTNELSSPIHPTIETVNPTNFNLATSIFHQYVYWLGVPSGGVSANNQTITYDRRYQAFSVLNHITPESFCVFIDSTNTEYICFTDANTNLAYYITPGSYNANGAAYNCQWTSKCFDLGDFNVYKRWITCTLYFQQLGGAVTVNIFTDNGTLQNSFTLGSTPMGGIGFDLFGGQLFGGSQATINSTTTVTNNVPYRFKVSFKARTIQVQVVNNKANQTFALLGLAFRYRLYSSFSWSSALTVQQ